jgi:hypothetical protein
MTPSTIAQTLASIQAKIAYAQQLLDAGDKETDDTAAVTDYQLSAGSSDTATSLAGNVTIILAQQDPSTAGYDAAVKSLIESASASDSAAGGTHDRPTTRAAAIAGIASATAALNYATQANQSAAPTPPRVSIGLFAGLAIIAAGVTWYTVRNLRRAA